MLGLVAGCATPDARDEPPDAAEGPIPRLVGDLDGDGKDEAVIELSGNEHPGRKGIWGLYRRAGADLIPVRVTGEGPLRFAIGGGARSREGMWCRDVVAAPGTEVIVVRVQERSGSPWVKHVYTWAGRDLKLHATHKRTADESHSPARLLDRSLTLHCGSFDSRAASD